MGKTTDLTPEELATQAQAAAEAQAAADAQVTEIELTTTDKLEEVIQEYRATTNENTPFYFVILQNLEEALSKMK